MDDILKFMGHPWLDLGIAVAFFSLAPDLLLRLLALLYPKGSDRPKELIAELRAVPRWERPFWVAEQLLMILTEGWGDRRQARRDRFARRGRMVRVRSYSTTGGRVQAQMIKNIKERERLNDGDPDKS